MTGDRILKGLQSALDHIHCPMCKGLPWKVQRGQPPRITIEPCPSCGAKVHPATAPQHEGAP